MSLSSLPPLFYLPLSSSHAAPSDTHKHANYLVVKVPPLFIFANLIGPPHPPTPFILSIFLSIFLVLPPPLQL